MTATVTEITVTTIRSNIYNALSTTIGLITILLLIALLLEKELIRAFGSPRSGPWMQALDIAIVPLLLASGLVIVRRFVDLLR